MREQEKGTEGKGKRREREGKVETEGWERGECEIREGKARGKGKWRLKDGKEERRRERKEKREKFLLLISF